MVGPEEGPGSTGTETPRGERVAKGALRAGPAEGIEISPGVHFDPYRSRWAGVLTPDEISACRKYGIPIAFDCAQIGWVASTCEDDGDANIDLISIIQDHRRELARTISELMAMQAADELAPGEARSRGLEAAATLEASVPLPSVVSRDKLHTVLQQEVVRFLGAKSLEPGPGDAFEYRPWRVEDAEAYAGIFGNERVWEHLPESWPGPLDVETAASMIEAANLGGHHAVYAVLRDGEIIGQIRLMFNQDYPGLRAAEVAYVLGEAYWGQGLMSRILAEFTARSLATHGLDFLCAWILPENVASARCAERAGYLRDEFSGEAELATQVDRERFQRYKCFSADFSR